MQHLSSPQTPCQPLSLSFSSLVVAIITRYQTVQTETTEHFDWVDFNISSAIFKVQGCLILKSVTNNHTQTHTQKKKL